MSIYTVEVGEMVMSSVVRMLTLYKQHYRSQYDEVLDKGYTCWGYYDCMNVESVNSFKSRRILKTKGHADVTDLWYQMAEQGEELEARYGCQYIGLFGDDVDGEFWNEQSIFLCVVFVQIEHTDKESIKEKLTTVSGDGWKIKSKVYRTLDNMDYVCCLKGNNYTEIMNHVNEIKKIKETSYTHAIAGVNTDLLKNRKEEVMQHLAQEKVDEIRLQIVTRNILTAQEWWNECCGHIEIEPKQIREAHVLGHHNLEVLLTDVTMKTAVELLEEGEGTTHTAAFYGEQIYNINTTIIPKRSGMKNSETPGHNDPKIIQTWCRNKIKELKAKFSNIKSVKDEALYSYYISLLRSLNMLAQYEEFKISKELFYMVAPAFDMFLQQLKIIELNFENDINLEKQEMYGVSLDSMEELKDSVCAFLETINEIVYRAVHTDQIFLAIPGYSGVICDVPLKLCLLYLSYANKIGTILSGQTDKQYCCYIVPVINAKPITTLTEFEFVPKHRLIAIRTSQRSLYMPRAFFIIMTHELAHYIGEETRERKMRLEKLVYIYAFALTEYIMDRKMISNRQNEQLLQLLENGNKERVLEYVKTYLYKELKNVIEISEKQGGQSEQLYHFSYLGEKIQNICLELLCDTREELTKCIHYIDDDTMNTIVHNPQGAWEVVRNAQQNWEQNIKRIMASGISDKLVINIMRLFREVYSDIVAVSLLALDKDWECYLEAFSVSEGVETNESLVPKSLILRIALVVESIVSQNVNAKEAWENMINSAKNNPDSVSALANLVNQWRENRTDIKCVGQEIFEQKVISLDKEFVYTLDTTWKYMLEYTKQIYCTFNKKIQSEYASELITNVRDLFACFKNEEKSDKKFFEQYDIFVDDYCTELQSVLQNSCRNTGEEQKE